MRLLTSIKPLIAATLLTTALAASAAGVDRFMNGQSFYGQPAAAEATGRSVNLDSTRYLNVTYGETVVFRNAGRQFAWTFNGLDRRSLDIAKIAPAGFSTKPFVIYIADDPENGQ